MNCYKQRIYIFLIAFAIFSSSVYAANDSIFHKPIELQAVTVTEKRVFTPINLSVVSRNQITENRNSSLLPVITEQVPALFITSRGVMGYGVATGAAGGMTIRGIGGSPTSGVLVAINGNPQFMGLMGHPLADSYQTMMAERVEVATGAMSAQYGSNAMGGVINIITRKAQQDTILTNANLMYGSYNTLSAGAGNLMRKGKFNSFAALDYSRTDGHRKNMDFEQYSAFANLGYDFSPYWQSSANINLTNFKASNPGSITVPLNDNDADVLRGATAFTLTNKYKKTSGALNLFYNFGTHKINEGYRAGEEPLNWRFRSNDYMAGVSANQRISLFNRNTIIAMFDYQLFGGRVQNKFLDGRPDVEILDKTMNDVAGYLGFQQFFSRNLMLTAGLRADYNEHFDAVEWVPHASLNYVAANNTRTIKAIVSKGFRYPTIGELFYLPPRNPDLKPERLMNYEIAVSQDLLNKNLNLGLNLYYINGNNSIQTVFADSAPRFMNTGKIENYGLEFLAQYRVNQHFNLSANYAWLNMEHKVIASPKHKLYAGLHYTRQKWSASSGVQYVSGLYCNPKTESFVLWNLQASYRITKMLEIFAKGENLLNQKYEINAGFPMPGAMVLGGINVNF